MARRRRKYRKRIPLKPIQKLPTIFECPNCGAKALTVTINKKERNEEGRVKAIIKCGKCGLYSEMWVPEIYEPVDVYSKFLDRFLEGSIEYTLTKKEEISLEKLISSEGSEVEEGFENWKGREES